MQNPEQSKLMELVRDYANILWQEGVQTGWSAAAESIIERAGKLYAEGNDELAGHVRSTGFKIREGVRNREREEKEKRNKRRNEIYKEILGQLEDFSEKEISK